MQATRGNQTPRKAAPGGTAWRGALAITALLFLSPPLAAQTPSASSEGDPVGVYFQAIQQAQTEGGPYAIELVDLYFGYAQALIDDGDLEAARDAFHRTVMVSRVNHGPNSLQQADYLYGIAGIESQLGNLEESVSVLEHIYRIHAMNYGEVDPAMLPVVEELYEWYKQNRPLRGPLVGASDLLNRSYLTERLAVLSEASYGIGDERTALRYRDAGQVHFRAILQMLQTPEPPNPELVFNAEENAGRLVFQRAMGTHFKAGEESFERAIESWRLNPNASDLQRAEAIAQLGDWYLALKHFRAAEKQYERAYELLAVQDQYTALADRYLGQPAPLRFLNPAEMWMPDLDAPVPTEGLEVGMSVSRNGRLMQIDFLNAPPGEFADELANFKNRLENTRFRPAIVDGQVQKMDYFVWRPILQSPNIAAHDGGG